MFASGMFLCSAHVAFVCVTPCHCRFLFCFDCLCVFHVTLHASYLLFICCTFPPTFQGEGCSKVSSCPIPGRCWYQVARTDETDQQSTLYVETPNPMGSNFPVNYHTPFFAWVSEASYLQTYRNSFAIQSAGRIKVFVDVLFKAHRPYPLQPLRHVYYLAFGIYLGLSPVRFWNFYLYVWEYLPVRFLEHLYVFWNINFISFLEYRFETLS